MLTNSDAFKGMKWKQRHAPRQMTNPVMNAMALHPYADFRRIVPFGKPFNWNIAFHESLRSKATEPIQFFVDHFMGKQVALCLLSN